MNNKIISCIIAGALLTCGVVGVNTVTTYAADTQAQTGPVISVTKTKFLLQEGQQFDFAKELGLKITDAKDGDITKQVKIPEIKTDKVNNYTFTIKATDSKGLVATKDIIINVIKIADDVKLNNINDAKTYDLNKLITGDTKGLTTSLSSIDEKNNSFVMKVSDGVNTITKTVKVTIDKLPAIGGDDDKTTQDGDKQTAKEDATKDKGSAQGDLTSGSGVSDTPQDTKAAATKDGDKTDAKTVTSPSSGKLPKTGDVSSAVEVLGAGAVVAGSALAYLKMKKRK